MVYDGMIVGKFVKLRSIDVNDASFSYNIRESKKAKGMSIRNYFEAVGQRGN